MKKLFLVITFLLLLLGSYLFIPETKINYDMTIYLPSDSNTKLGMDILTEEFGKESMIQVMIMDIDIGDLLIIKENIKDIENISNVIWIDDYVDIVNVPLEYVDPSVVALFYSENDALITIVFDVDAYDTSIDDSIQRIREILSDYQTHIRGEPINHSESRRIANGETIKIMVLLIPIVLLLLVLSSHAWAEPILIIITLGVAVLFNLFTNGLLSNVSFITQTMSLALQLALSIDYALFMIHRYYEERLSNPAKEASRLAFKHSIKPITISALTTIAGFSALTLMRFTIGLDIALVLSKGILFSYISTMILLPILLIWLDPLLTKTKHRVFFPSFSNLARFQLKYKHFLFALLVIVIGFSFFMQNKTQYLYGESSEGNPDSVVNLDLQYINQRFGINHQMVVIIPNETVQGEVELVSLLSTNENVIRINSLVLEADPNIPREFLPNELVSYYVGESYSRIILTTSIYEENSELFLFVENLKYMISTQYDEYYIVGQASALSDIQSSIKDQGIWIMMLTVLGVSLIVGLIFKSIKIPIILVSIIIGAIWLNMTLLVIGDTKILYIGYLIVMSIQLGATIDYAVLLTHRYIEERKSKDAEQAMLTAFTQSSISIIISGSILTIVGFVEGFFSDIDSVTKIGQLLGSGALISLLMILFFLPVSLLVFDKWIIKKVKR
ncbi:MAG: MMPL family transporter [Acholeplasmataceae bacterium]|nr:MMPL family transporter [Acholeplasmataceae bacterium]